MARDTRARNYNERSPEYQMRFQSMYESIGPGITVRFVCVLFLALVHGGVLAGEVEGPADSDPPIFIYSFTGNPDVTPGPNVISPIAKSALAVGLVELGEAMNKPYLKRLESSLGEIDQQKRFEQAYGCLFKHEDSNQPCSSVQFLKATPTDGVNPSAELMAAMKASSKTSAWALSTTEQFFSDGYNLSVFAVEIRVDGASAKISRRLQVMYMNFFSAGADAEFRGLAHDAKDAKPRLGSKEARSSYWFSGSPSLIETTIASAPLETAQLMRTLLSMTGSSGSDEFDQRIASKPKLRELRKQGMAACKANYCSMRIYNEDKDRLQLGATYKGVPHIISVNRWGLE